MKRTGKSPGLTFRKTRRRRHFDRQPARGDRQRGLHIERGAVDIAVEVELDGDGRDAER